MRNHKVLYQSVFWLVTVAGLCIAGIDCKREQKDSSPVQKASPESVQNRPIRSMTGETPQPLSTVKPETTISLSEKGVAAMEITSTAFAPGQEIPRRYTGEGEDLSPPLKWTGIPEGTKEWALICDDPDAPTPQPWVHWVIYGIPAGTNELHEGVSHHATLDARIKAKQGKNSWSSDNIGYRGPMPPPGHGIHHYHFKLYALNVELDLEAGLDKGSLLRAMKDHIIEEAELIGTYQR